MDVYLVPASATRYALYCEVSWSTPDEADVTRSTFWSRRVASFKRAIDEGEAEAQGTVPEAERRGRLRRLVTRKLAEAVAEQRLLWHLRNETSATLIYPETLDAARALEIARTEFAADFARHRRWLVIDGLLTAITGPLFFFIPGPNIVSWYFSFRAVGHYFSMKGARQAQSVIVFTPHASPHLTTVARALSASPDERASMIDAAAEALGLERLASFVDRVADA